MRFIPIQSHQHSIGLFPPTSLLRTRFTFLASLGGLALERSGVDGTGGRT